LTQSINRHQIYSELGVYSTYVLGIFQKCTNEGMTNFGLSFRDGCTRPAAARGRLNLVHLEYSYLNSMSVNMILQLWVIATWLSRTTSSWCSWSMIDMVSVGTSHRVTVVSCS